MKIRNHRLEGGEYLPAQWTGGVIAPEIVVLHDTAGRLEKGNSARYLAKNDAKVSVHFVVERDGSIVQLVPANRRANHCGQSNFHGRKNCNDFSIGVEIVNPGKMLWIDDDTCRAWWGEDFPMGIGVAEGDPAGSFSTSRMTTREHGAGVWMDYPPEQIEAVERLLTALFRDVKSLRDITTHWYISPGRKVDTNPLFPLEHLRARVLGRDDPAEAEAEERSEKVAGEFVFIGPKSGLNMRRWPSFNPNVITAIPHGEVVHVIRKGSFDGLEWLRVLFAGQEGWIVASYTQPAQ